MSRCEKQFLHRLQSRVELSYSNPDVDVRNSFLQASETGVTQGLWQEALFSAGDGPGHHIGVVVR